MSTSEPTPRWQASDTDPAACAVLGHVWPRRGFARPGGLIEMSCARCGEQRVVPVGQAGA